MKNIFVALMLSAASLMAERDEVKPADFEPLTSLPWNLADSTLQSTLDAVFHETNTAIRYAVLAKYLSLMPVKQLGNAFDVCITLEGTQTPNELVELFLDVWASRDPKACWQRTKKLFHLVGIEEGWLMYDSWKRRPRITVQDLSAIQGSKFWIESAALKEFPLGVEHSSLPKKERLQILREFAGMWFNAFGSWPGYESPDKSAYERYTDTFSPELQNAFEMRQNQLRELGSRQVYNQELGFEIGLRRWLLAYPASAPQIVATAQDTKWPAPGQMQPRSAGPSIELLMIWSKADLPGMINWAKKLDNKKDQMAVEIKGMLMSRVDSETRESWLAEARAAKPEDEAMQDLLASWANWDPKSAFAVTIAEKNSEAMVRVANSAVYGPWNSSLYNTSYYGMGVLKELDFESLPADFLNSLPKVIGWETTMEQWGSIDIGEAARFGLNFLLQTNYAPRGNLIKFFSGLDIYAQEDGMIDRTFCALRVWAVFKPMEMKAWISTLKDAQMRTALTWLLKNPWGGSPKAAEPDSPER